MSNHVHLRLMPGEAGTTSRMMPTFGRNYVGLFHARRRRTGTLGKCRYKACRVDSDSYFLACNHYIELNLVRAWMVAAPGGYPWSSFGANAQGRVGSLLAPHARYLALGSDRAARASAHRALFAEALPDTLVQEIRTYLQQQKVLGTDKFRFWFAARTGQAGFLRYGLAEGTRAVQIVADTFCLPFCLDTFCPCPGRLADRGMRIARLGTCRPRVAGHRLYQVAR